MENRIRFASALSVLLFAAPIATAAAGVWDGEVVVPIVLSSSGLNESFFTSELTLTNRGTTDAAIELSYTSAFGGGTGVARDTLAAGRQKIVPNALEYLAAQGAPIPSGGNRGGTLRVRFTGLSAPNAGAATVRTTTAVARGRAGLSYAGTVSAGRTGAAYLCGLRQNANDRSNVALMNTGGPSEGDVTLRLMIFSGESRDANFLPDVTLAPGEFRQIDGVLASNGLALTSGYVKVQRLAGSAPWDTYAVINDQGTSDGSFVSPIFESDIAGRSGISLPVAVETATFATEAIVTNFGSSSKTVRLTFVASAIQSPDGSATLTLSLPPYGQRILPSFVQALRDQGSPGLGASGATYAGAVFLTVPGGDVSGLAFAARTSAPGGGGRFGLFYAGVPFGKSAQDSAWLHGLQQDGENRSNLAIVNTGEVDGSSSTFRVELYDGATGRLAGLVPGITLPARGFTQLSSILAQYAPGTSSAYARVTRTAGTNPFLCYAVVNDGGSPQQRSDDGAFVAMDLGSPAGTIPVRLERLSQGPETASFGVPFRPGAVSDVARIRVSAGGVPLDAVVKPLLWDYDPNGDPTSLRAVLVQVPVRLAVGERTTVVVSLNEEPSAPSTATRPFAELSFESPETARVTDRTIVNDAGTYRLQESNTRDVTLFRAREPLVLAHFPPGTVAASGLLGAQVSQSDVASDADRAGLAYLSDVFGPFVRSALYKETYALNPDPASVVDPVVNFEGWLYDRCATLLTAAAHLADPELPRHAYRACQSYGARITLDGPNRGIFTGKPDPDTKYSHLRGLFAYYALTGDEGALAAGRAIADLWNTDPQAIGPYRQGHLRGADRLWTERLLGTGMEGLFYGFRLTGDKKYLTAFREVLDTAYRHITTSNQAELVAINLDPNTPPFPPQNCFIHTALQHDEGNANEPWCSAWMSELLIDSLLGYQAQTGDARVDEIFVRLARFLRDVGSSYFQGDPLPDTFLRPSVCYDPTRGVDTRMLIPLYGAGLFPNGSRGNYGQYEDTEHCADATALTAAALRALVRQGKFDAGGPIGPFASEGASFLQLHHELSFCATNTFANWTRLRRDPAAWTSSALAAGAANPAAFITANRIGFPTRPSTPQRKLSWWFNTSMLQFGLLRDAGLAVPELRPGAVQPAGVSCPVP